MKNWLLKMPTCVPNWKEKSTGEHLIQNKDTARINQYEYVSAKVVGNSTSLYKNFITIDKGAVDGVVPGMAAISNLGAVGKVKSVSDHYAVLISLLNVDEQDIVRDKKNKSIRKCAVGWC
jgi:rod shape-determining protein MreC